MYYLLFALFLLFRSEVCLSSDDIIDQGTVLTVRPFNLDLNDDKPITTKKIAKRKNRSPREKPKVQFKKKRTVEPKKKIVKSKSILLENPELLLSQSSLSLVSDVNTLEQINECLEKISTISFSQESSDHFLDLLHQEETRIKSTLSETSLASLARDNQIKYKTHKVNWIFDKWPHQTWVEAVMGELFYPHELRKTDDLPCDLYERPVVRYRLGVSASYNNPLAYHHLASVMANYFSRDKEDQLVHKKAKSLESLYKRKAKDYFLQGLTEGSPYTKAVSSWNLSSPETARLVQTAIDDQSEYRLLSYISFNPKKENLRVYYQKALEAGYTEALIKLSSIAESPVESVLWSLKAAEEENIATGYYNVALKLDGQGYKTIKTQMDQIQNPIILGLKEKFSRDFSPGDIITYLDKAGDMGMATALREKARILLSLGYNEDVIEGSYIKAANMLGDEYSWYSLGMMYAQKGDREQAEDYLQKAGIRGYFSYLKEHTNPEKSKQALKSIYQHLNIISNLSKIK